jgi:hypothetical protein
MVCLSGSCAACALLALRSARRSQIRSRPRHRNGRAWPNERQSMSASAGRIYLGVPPRTGKFLLKRTGITLNQLKMTNNPPICKIAILRPGAAAGPAEGNKPRSPMTVDMSSTGFALDKRRAHAWPCGRVSCQGRRFRAAAKTSEGGAHFQRKIGDRRAPVLEGSIKFLVLADRY